MQSADYYIVQLQGRYLQNSFIIYKVVQNINAHKADCDLKVWFHNNVMLTCFPDPDSSDSRKFGPNMENHEI